MAAITGTLGQRITQLRSKCRMSQKDLADFLYVNQATVSRWEKGIRFPDDDLLIRMAERFGVEPGVLLQPAPEMPVVILVDDEPISLEVNVPMMQELAPDCEVHGFPDSRSALDFAAGKRIDVAFLDIDLFRENGLDLAGKLSAIFPDVNIIFLTGHPEFMKEAFSLHVSGYVLKPMSPDDFLHEMNHLRFPVAGLAAQTGKENP